MSGADVMVHVDAGAGALSRGDVGRAKACFLRGARDLLLLARNSLGELRRQRTEQAWHLMVQARRLDDTLATQALSVGKDQSTGNDKSESKQFHAAADTGLTLDDVAGADEVKRIFRAKFLYPMQNPGQAATYRQNGCGGVLLYGPPGTGKTYLARALAGELGAPVFSIKPSDIMSKWVGEAEKHVAELFAQARQHPVALIFVDEIDALAPARSQSDSGGASDRVLAQLLAELDGFEKHGSRLLFVGATNAPWNIDPALLRAGRFDALAYVGLPDEVARHIILTGYLQGVPLDAGVDLWAVAAEADGCSGAEVFAIASQAAQSAYYDVIENGIERPVSQADFDRALGDVRRLASPEMLQRFAAFRGKGG